MCGSITFRYGFHCLTKRPTTTTTTTMMLVAVFSLFFLPLPALFLCGLSRKCNCIYFHTLLVVYISATNNNKYNRTTYSFYYYFREHKRLHCLWKMKDEIQKSNNNMKKLDSNQYTATCASKKILVVFCTLQTSRSFILYTVCSTVTFLQCTQNWSKKSSLNIHCAR